MTSSTVSETRPTMSHSHRTVAMRKEANEQRKTLKPLMEKRRRARINDSLNHLKTLILPLIGKDNCRYSKLEKADILEMTVRFLHDITPTPSKSANESFNEGYKACLQRVSVFLPETSLDQGTCQRVNDFVQQATVSVKPACNNCCGQSPVSLKGQQRLLGLVSKVPRMESRTNRPIRPIPNRPQALPQSVSANMWRPW